MDAPTSDDNNDLEGESDAVSAGEKKKALRRHALRNKIEASIEKARRRCDGVGIRCMCCSFLALRINLEAFGGERGTLLKTPRPSLLGIELRCKVLATLTVLARSTCALANRSGMKQ